MSADKPDTPPAAPEAPPLSPLLEKVKARAGQHLQEYRSFRGDDRVHSDRAELLAVARLLRDDPELAFDMLLDVTAIDYFGQPDDFEMPRDVWDRDRAVMRRRPMRRGDLILPPPGPLPRFALVYHLVSTRYLHRLRLKCRVPEDDPTIASVSSIWPSANWLERETYDLYGIKFIEHPDLRRIYLYEEFVGHPLRKDYSKYQEQPIEAYVGPGAKEPRRPR